MFCLVAIGITGTALGGEEPARDYLQRLQAQSGSPGVSAAVLVGDRIVFSAGVGSADLESGAPQTGTTVHNIGSISKTQAVVAVMQLVEQGKVQLDAEIQRYAPWFPRKPQPITVRQILTHTSGIRHYKEGEFGPAEVMSFRHYDSFEESTRFWREDPLLFAPGSHWAYSSYASDLMQAIVESASGQPFEEYMTEHVWRPAGMINTQFDVPSRIVPHRGRGYERNPKVGRLENAANEDVSYKYAGGGVISTDEDLCRFGRALNAGVLLKPASLAELYRLQLPKDLPRFEPDAPHLPSISGMQALIFRVQKDSQGRVRASHSGAVKGTVSEFYNYYQNDVVVALHFNAGSGGVDIGKAAETLAALYLPPVPPRAAGTPDDRSREAAVESVFSALQQRGSPGAAVGVYRQGALIFSRGYGLADLDHAVPVTPQTVFNLASVSKQFTAFSIALLAREGKLDLQADIRTYLPDMPDVGQRITVADLVHHVSGVRDYMALSQLSGHDDDSLLRQSQALSLLRRQRHLSFPPQTQWEYSNSGYTLLAQIVRSVSGLSLRDFLQQRIFGPLHMDDTRLHDDLSRVEPGYAVGYESGSGERPWLRAVYNRETVGPGNLLSNVGDLAKWAANLIHPTVGDAALIEQLTAPVTLRDGTPVNYGFGLHRASIAGHAAITHNGGISGFNTVIAVFPQDDLAVIILANRPYEVDEAMEKIANIYLDPRPAAPGKTPPAIVAKDAMLDRLSGYYQASHGPMLVLERQGPALMLHTLATPAHALKFWADGTFGRGDYTATRFRPQQDAAGRIVALEELRESPDVVRVTRRLERVAASEPTPQALATLTGSYHGEEIDTTYELTVESGHVVLRSLYQPEPEILAPAGPKRFDAVSGPLPGLSLTVEPGADGRPGALLLDYGHVLGLRLDRVSSPPAAQ